MRLKPSFRVSSCFFLPHPGSSHQTCCHKQALVSMTSAPRPLAAVPFPPPSLVNLFDIQVSVSLKRGLFHPGRRNSLPTPVSGLENSMDCMVHGTAKSRTRLSDFHLPGPCSRFGFGAFPKGALSCKSPPLATVTFGVCWLTLAHAGLWEPAAGISPAPSPVLSHGQLEIGTVQVFIVSATHQGLFVCVFVPRGPVTQHVSGHAACWPILFPLQAVRALAQPPRPTCSPPSLCPGLTHSMMWVSSVLWVPHPPPCLLLDHTKAKFDVFPPSDSEDLERIWQNITFWTPSSFYGLVWSIPVSISMVQFSKGDTVPKKCVLLFPKEKIESEQFSIPQGWVVWAERNKS